MVAKSPANCKHTVVSECYNNRPAFWELKVMLRNTLRRRLLGSMLVGFGALLLWLAPELWAGSLAILMVAIVLEIIGIRLEHEDG
ncbi:hypothetical protein MIT9_P1126 [Methylomarinovum caldicuralii]|uniref:DUF2892 domain-containing protein n=2 Tax=Methylomarinovum caldicuralii TaxID=438856 RepID=A0AAU9CNL6_9GAMM|nr:hypothetical protein MIT9_P1126 [Methylomarinovum caldicuralii]